MSKKTCILIVIIMLLLILSNTLVYAEKSIPEKIKIGLNHGKNDYHKIRIKSKSQIRINFELGSGHIETISTLQTNSISFRKDDYYNLLDNEVNRIEYIKAVKYNGRLIGPYHIQIGNEYEDIVAANKALSTIKNHFEDAFLVYSDGWKIWSQLLLDKNQCMDQIESMKGKFNEQKYTIIEPGDNRIQLIDSFTNAVLYMVDTKSISILNPFNEAISLLEYNGSNYRGDINLTIGDNGSIKVINEVSLENYLYGVVPCESPASWHIEALKAQAVAARNYAALNIGKHSKEGYDLCNTQDCQVYLGYDKEHVNTNKAVDETKGKLLFYEDKLANTFYHSSSGGHTENSENVWYDAVPYLRGVKDQYSLGSPNDNWTTSLEKSFIEEKLRDNNISIGSIIDIVPIDISEFGRVKQIKFIGTEGSTVMEKERIRILFGTSNIKSTWYDVKTESDINIFDIGDNKISRKRTSEMYLISASGQKKLSSRDKNITIKGLFDSKRYNTTPETYIFSGKGWGHGLGMSQYGAKGMAEAGYDYKQILEYYYKGTKVK